MKSLACNFIFTCLLLGAISHTAHAQTKASTTELSLQSDTKIVLPTAKEAIRVLLANGDIRMSSIKSCRSMKTSEDDRTIFDYLSGILAFQAEPKSKTSIMYDVKLIKGKTGHFWEVNLMFKGLDEEGGDPWDNGFRFLMRTRDKRMVRSSLQCTG